MSTALLSHNAIVNGIDTDAVRTLIASVEAEPGKGVTHWRVASAWQHGTQSRAQVESFAIGGADVPRRFSIDVDEPLELGGANAHANPQEYLLAALNACMIVGFTALCALQGIALQKLEITTEGEIDLRGFFGLDSTIAPGYRELRTRVVIKGDGTEEQFRQINERVLATSPNVHNITRAIQITPTLIIEGRERGDAPAPTVPE
jgi:uncharacterized OsmC-like protein